MKKNKVCETCKLNKYCSVDTKKFKPNNLVIDNFDDAIITAFEGTK